MVKEKICMKAGFVWTCLFYCHWILYSDCQFDKRVSIWKKQTVFETGRLLNSCKKNLVTGGRHARTAVGTITSISWKAGTLRPANFIKPMSCLLPCPIRCLAICSAGLMNLFLRPTAGPRFKKRSNAANRPGGKFKRSFPSKRSTLHIDQWSVADMLQICRWRRIWGENSGLSLKG